MKSAAEVERSRRSRRRRRIREIRRLGQWLCDGETTTSSVKATEREIRLCGSQVEIETRRRLRGNTASGERDRCPKGERNRAPEDKEAEGGLMSNGKEGNCHLYTYYQKNE